jgi:hypothetical protein
MLPVMPLTQTCCCASAIELKGWTTRAFLCFQEKETDSVVWKSVEVSRSETTLCRPMFSRCTGSLPLGSLHWESADGETVSKLRMAMEYSHGSAACVHRIVRESFHGDTVSLLTTSEAACAYRSKQLIKTEGLIDWLCVGLEPYSPEAPRPLLTDPRPFVPHYNLWESCPFSKFPDGPQPHILNIVWLQKKEPEYECLSEARALHRQIIWAEVSSSTPHFLHNGLYISSIKWRCLVRLLCPVRKPVTALNCILLTDKSLALVPRQGPEINSRACLLVLPRLSHCPQCWFTNQRLILFLRSCLETPKASSGPTNLEAEPHLASPSAVSLPLTLACPGTQYSPMACREESHSVPLIQ